MRHQVIKLREELGKKRERRASAKDAKKDKKTIGNTTGRNKNC